MFFYTAISILGILLKKYMFFVSSRRKYQNSCQPNKKHAVEYAIYIVVKQTEILERLFSQLAILQELYSANSQSKGKKNICFSVQSKQHCGKVSPMLLFIEKTTFYFNQQFLQLKHLPVQRWVLEPKLFDSKKGSMAVWVC